MSSLVGSNVVILARDANQSIFKPSWLVKNGILQEEEANGDDVQYVPGLTRVRIAAFELLVLPDRLQIQFPPDAEDGDAIVERVLGGICRTLPHTPLVAVGLNYQHVLEPAEPAKFFEWNRKWLAAPWALKHTDQADHRTRFGCSFAYDYRGARMRVRVAVSVRPGEPRPQPQDKDLPYVVNVHFNLHRDLPLEDPAKELFRMLSSWQAVRNQTGELMTSLSDGTIN